MRVTNTLVTYYRLTKPGIIRGNALAAAAGFFLATPAGGFDAALFILMLLGLSLVIASGCVFNNVMDRRIDAAMARTKQRALVTGRVAVSFALVYASLLGLAGFTVLGVFTNLLTTVLAAVGLVFYVLFYGWAKRRSLWGTEVGSISGAIPPVVGYAAVSGRFDLGALLLFLTLVFWQMPHFYAIAVYRLSDYKSAGLPVLPAVKGATATVHRMVAYIWAFVVSLVALAAAGPGTWLFGIVTVTVSLFWLRKALTGLHTDNPEVWAKGIFRFSLLVMVTFFLMSGLDLIFRSIYGR